MSTEMHQRVTALTQMAPMEWFWDLMPAGLNPSYPMSGHGILVKDSDALKRAGYRAVQRLENGIWLRSHRFIVGVSAHVFPDEAAGLKRWVHVSMSRGDRCPSWEELVALRDMLFTPNVECIQVLPRKSEHVSIHDNCLHLFHSPDGNGVPDFTMGTGQI